MFDNLLNRGLTGGDTDPMLQQAFFEAPNGCIQPLVYPCLRFLRDKPLQVSINPLVVIYTLASELTLSHNYSCLRLLILSISTFKFISAQRTSRCNSSSRAICSSSIRGHPRSQLS